MTTTQSEPQLIPCLCAHRLFILLLIGSPYGPLRSPPPLQSVDPFAETLPLKLETPAPHNQRQSVIMAMIRVIL